MILTVNIIVRLTAPLTELLKDQRSENYCRKGRSQKNIELVRASVAEELKLDVSLRSGVGLVTPQHGIF